MLDVIPQTGSLIQRSDLHRTLQQPYCYSGLPKSSHQTTQEKVQQLFRSTIIHRKTFHQFFQQHATPEYHSVEKAEVMTYAWKLLASPGEYYSLTRHYTSAVILQLAYGYNLERDDDPYLDLVDEAMVGFNAMVVPGSFLVDHLPLLKYVPSPGWWLQAKGRTVGYVCERCQRYPMKANGTAVPSFATQNINNFSVVPGEDPPMEDVIRNCAGVAYTAGTDTVWFSLGDLNVHN
ncbi:hypothetical protein PM082_016471 [Marasmius tenuissimus]|nr:hypothetical protein PM082_016471 [Marasmius tenuissimus]